MTAFLRLILTHSGKEDNAVENILYIPYSNCFCLIKVFKLPSSFGNEHSKLPSILWFGYLVKC